jgi:Kazal-type serine protease inhibitor domain
MKTLIFVLSIITPLSIVGCKKDSTTDSDCVIGDPNPLILCTADYKPVCGCNQKTYSNACMAEAAGVKTFTEGACK